ncbi:hypothetical protein Daus18300_013550 [Diaporthe australafricana]|uniref:Uncharacterized protein n=1 Tax=Diaporthe australafricana TaxID=127596 RepID=A0ABR3VYS9_9PEZI
MDYCTTSEREKVREGDEQAINAVVSMLSSAIAPETASFMRHTSLQLYPEAMRRNPNTPAATSLREYHFMILMTNVATAFAKGRDQDFADDRVALGNLLDEECKHKPLGARFRRLMALWLQDNIYHSTSRIF